METKKKLRITFCDFWPNFLFDDNYLYNLLSLKYDVIIDDKYPDLVFFTSFSTNHRSFDKDKVIKIFYTGENVRPNYDECHFSLSFDYSIDERNYRLPLWMFHLNWFNRPYRDDRDQAFLFDLEDFLNKKPQKKTKHCSFIASSPVGKRLDFVPKFFNYKPIHCGGRLFNNVPLVPGRGDQIYKIEYLKDFKFNISFENTSHPGYCTEKIINSMFANCIPLYWGDSLVHQDFNTDSFVNWHDFNNDENFIEQIIKIDNDDKLYYEILNQPWFKDNKIPDFAQPENVLSFFQKIINK